MGLVRAKLQETAAHVLAMSVLVLNLRKIQLTLLQFCALLPATGKGWDYSLDITYPYHLSVSHPPTFRDEPIFWLFIINVNKEFLIRLRCAYNHHLKIKI